MLFTIIPGRGTGEHLRAKPKLFPALLYASIEPIGGHLGKLPGGSVLGDRQAGGFGIADDLLGCWIEPDRAAELEREQAEQDRHIHVDVIEDAARRSLA